MYFGIPNNNDMSFHFTPHYFYLCCINALSQTHSSDVAENPTFIYFKQTHAGGGTAHVLRRKSGTETEQCEKELVTKQDPALMLLRVCVCVRLCFY